MRSLLVALCLAFCAIFACSPSPGPVGPLPTYGGTSSTGGATSGGSVDRAGAAGSGGVATGGTSAATTESIAWPECAPPTQKLQRPNVEELRKRLGRHRAGPITRRAKASYTVLELPDVCWTPLAPTLDQGSLGSCTGNAGLQVRVSKPWTWTRTLDPLELESLAVAIYSGASKRDPFDGSWPPDDTGSNGASVMAEMYDLGLITGWDSVVTIEGLQRALQRGPCIFGTNWYTGMFTPDRCGQVSVTGVIEGGHEYAIIATQKATKRFLARNSWGDGFGVRLRGFGGFFWLKFGDVQRLLSEGGEIECPEVDRPFLPATVLPARASEAS